MSNLRYYSLSLSCVPYFSIFSGLSILIAPSVFSNVYLCTDVSCILRQKGPGGSMS